jgi:hypothetical protein
MKYIFIEVFQTEFLSFGTKKYRIQGLRGKKERGLGFKGYG